MGCCTVTSWSNLNFVFKMHVIKILDVYNFASIGYSTKLSTQTLTVAPRILQQKLFRPLVLQRSFQPW